MNTIFKAEIEEGFFDLNGPDRQGNTHVFFSALAKKSASGFVVLDTVVAPTDLSFASSPDAPKEIFPFHEATE
jgi:hypothetical protein